MAVKNIENNKNKIIKNDNLNNNNLNNKISKHKKSNRFSFINKSIIVFFIIFMVAIIILLLHKKNIINLNPTFLGLLKFLIYSTTIVVIINIVLKISVNKIFTFFQDEIEIEQRILLAKLYSILIYFAGLSIILYLTGVEIKDITLFLGLITTGLAFAIRDIIMSFFVWLIVLTKKPFKIGDIITCGDDTGKVERIGTFYITIIKHNQNQLIRIPNKVLFDKNLINRGNRLISDEIKLTLTKLPDSLPEFINEINELLNSNINEKFEVELDTNQESPQIVINYSSNYKIKEQIKSKTLILIYDKYNSYFMKESK